MTIKYVDLFSGIGGIRLGVEQALEKFSIKSKCILSCEIDKEACHTYEINFGENPYGDVCKISDIENFDLLLAGFPCQPFSYAGKKRGFGDTRGTLFFEVERILRKYKPKVILLENVRGLLTHDNGRTFFTIKSTLNEIGYKIKYFLLNSSNFGVPQNRVRLYIIGIYKNEPNMSLFTDLGASDSHKFKNLIPQKSLLDLLEQKKYKTIETILEKNVPEKYYCSKEFEQKLKHYIGDNLYKLNGYRLIDYRGGNSLHSWEIGTKGYCSKEEIVFMNLLIKNRRKSIFGSEQDGKKLTIEQIKTFYNDNNILEVISSLKSKGYLKEIDGKFNPVCGNMSFEVFKFIDPQSISITLTSSDANRLGIIRNNRPCHITPRECARLQGFPDDFKLHNNDKFAYKQLGNSVSVPVIRAIMEDLLSKNLNTLGW